jgi:hypothetical protein
LAQATLARSPLPSTRGCFSSERNCISECAS